MEAISPVIATVIIVAVAIALSIAVALWITGLVTTFASFEKLEVVNAYATWNEGEKTWAVTIQVKNTGTKPATIDMLFINGIPHDKLSDAVSIPEGMLPKTLKPGEAVTIEFTIQQKSTSQVKFDHGITLSIVIHTASGGQYPASVTLP